MEFIAPEFVTPEFVAHWFGSVLRNTTRYAVFSISVWLVLWIALDRLLQGRRVRETRPDNRQLALEFLVSLRSVAIFSTIGLSIFFMHRAGFLPGPDIAAQWGAAYWWFSLVVMIVAHDAYFYWTHKWMHNPRVFKVFHRRHHKSHNPSPFTAYSFDLAEAVVLASFVPLFVFTVPTPWGVIGLFMLHQIFRNTLGHSGVELMPARSDGRPMFDFLTTTTHHDLHHAQAGWNFGLYFTWWDKLMGTEHPHYYENFARSVRKPLIEKSKVVADAQ